MQQGELLSPHLTPRASTTSYAANASILLRVYPPLLFSVGLVLAFVCAKKLPFFVFVLLWLALQGSYVAYGTRGRLVDRSILRFVAKLQLQAVFKVFSHLSAIYLVALFCDYLLGNEPGPAYLPAGTTAVEVISRQALNFAKAVSAWGAVIAFWRIHRLKRSGYDIEEIANGTFYERSCVIPAAGPAVEAAIALRLQQLQFDKAARFTRMFLESRPRARQSSSNRTALELTWPLCPTAVELTISRVETGSRVYMRCRLRGGLYRFELFPFPEEVTALLNFLQANLIDATDSEMRLANAIRKQDEFKHLAVEAQLRMLQTQIEPHFLFNTLANVQQMYRENIDEGEEMLSHLTAYFRGAVEGFRSDRSTVAKEMELSQRYLAIMKARMGDRLSFEFKAMDDVRHHPLPPAMLISLVENAIKHGIAPNMGGTIEVKAVQADDVVRLEVSDDGAGFSSVGGTGTGLTNLRDRLDALYGPRAWLEIDAGESGGFKASIVLPFEGLA